MLEPIRKTRQQKRELILVLVTAILLAFGVNLVTSYVSNILKENQYIFLLVIAIVFLFIAILLLKNIFFYSSTEIIRINGAVAFKVCEDTIKPIRILGYSFNNDFFRYLYAFLQENKAYANLFLHSKSICAPMEEFDPADLSYNSIMNSVLEFVVLNKLSLHLNAYFVENEIDRNRIIV